MGFSFVWSTRVQGVIGLYVSFGEETIPITLPRKNRQFFDIIGSNDEALQHARDGEGHSGYGNGFEYCLFMNRLVHFA